MTCTAAVFATTGNAGSPDAFTVPSVSVLPVAAEADYTGGGGFAAGFPAEATTYTVDLKAASGLRLALRMSTAWLAIR